MGDVVKFIMGDRRVHHRHLNYGEFSLTKTADARGIPDIPS
ncbi:MAG: hypothetical protein ACFBSG_06565 [Leptolyngbyaceae cyanobacterium]